MLDELDTEVFFNLEKRIDEMGSSVKRTIYLVNIIQYIVTVIAIFVISYCMLK
jgi:hypothetical protein